MLTDSLIDDNTMAKCFKRFDVAMNLGAQGVTTAGIPKIYFFDASRDTLVEVSMANKLGYRAIPLQGILRNRIRYTIKIKSDTLHLIDAVNFDYTQYQITDSAYLRKINSFSLSSYFDPKKEFLNSNILVDKKIEYAYPYLFLSYGDYRGKNNIGEGVLCKIDVTNGQRSTFLDYPAKYGDCDIRNGFTIFESQHNAYIDVIFRKADGIYRVDPATGSLIKKSTSVHFPTQYMCYDASMAPNLAYSSKIDLNDEENINMVHTAGGIFVFKRLRKNRKADRSKFALLVFNNNLEHQATYLLKSTVNPRLAVEYRNGVLVYEDSLERIHYYEVHKN